MHWNQVENWNSGTHGKNCTSDYLITAAARPRLEAGSALETEKDFRFVVLSQN